jgi:hypothetical protein
MNDTSGSSNASGKGGTVTGNATCMLQQKTESRLGTGIVTPSVNGDGSDGSGTDGRARHGIDQVPIRTDPEVTSPMGAPNPATEMGAPGGVGGTLTKPPYAAEW